VSSADGKAHLSKHVARVSGQHERLYVTVHGKPSAVLLATEDLESLEETIEILAYADTMRATARLEVEVARGEVEAARTWRRPWPAGAASGARAGRPASTAAPVTSPRPAPERPDDRAAGLRPPLCSSAGPRRAECNATASLVDVQHGYA
jgi:prevent-host-death family protein